MRATSSGDSWTLDGVKEPVVQGARADALVVTAALPDGGTGLFVVTDLDGVARDGWRHPRRRGAARVTFDGTAATPLGAGGDATGIVARVPDIARITACNEAIGLMEVALEQTSAYLKSRKQFGVTLNTFQALNFRAADMYVSLELARSLALWATMVLADGSGRRPRCRLARRAAGQSRRAPHRPGGDPAARRHRHDRGYSIGSYTSRLTALDHLLGDGHHHLGLLAAGVGGYDEVDPLP